MQNKGEGLNPVINPKEFTAWLDYRHFSVDDMHCVILLKRYFKQSYTYITLAVGGKLYIPQEGLSVYLGGTDLEVLQFTLRTILSPILFH